MMILFYFLSLLSFAISLAPAVTSGILYFKNKNNTNFAKQIKIIAIVDAVYLGFWILGSIQAGTLVQSADSVITALLNIGIAGTVLYCAWKMKNGKKLKSFFKNLGINQVLFIVYVITNIVILYQLAITLLNYIIVGIGFIIILWIADKFLGIGAGTALMSGSGGGGGVPGHCGSCSRFDGSRCIDNPGAVGSPMDSCGNYNPR